MKKFRLTIAIILILPVLLSFCIVAFILYALLSLFRLSNAADSTVHGIYTAIIWWILAVLGISLHVEGKANIPPKGSRVVYMANHQSMIDVPVVFYAGMWSGVIAKKELWKIPFLHGCMVTLKCIPLDRSSPKEGIKSIPKGVEQIKKGIPMMIYPEGTRSKTGEIAEFKAGSFKLATKAKALIVPVAIQNTRATFESSKGFGRVPVYVRILPAIDTAEMDEEQLSDIHTVVENEIRSAYSELPVYR